MGLESRAGGGHVHQLAKQGDTLEASGTRPGLSLILSLLLARNYVEVPNVSVSEVHQWRFKASQSVQTSPSHPLVIAARGPTPPPYPVNIALRRSWPRDDLMLPPERRWGDALVRRVSVMV